MEGCPMRYMYLISSPPNAGPPPQRLMEEIGKLSQQEATKRAMLDSGGLMPAGKSARIRVGRGELKVHDGPFAESKEVIGGYAIFEFATEAEAIASGVSFMELHLKYGEGWEGTCEMRQIMGKASEK
jgi:hypothetical protein